MSSRLADHLAGMVGHLRLGNGMLSPNMDVELSGLSRPTVSMRFSAPTDKCSSPWRQVQLKAFPGTYLS